MIYIFEGMDNCLKDTLIQELRTTLSGKTHVLRYSGPPSSVNAEAYQREHFKDMFDLLNLVMDDSLRSLILNRAHLGEAVYSPLYRGYSGDWIFDLEKEYLKRRKNQENIQLILLYDSNNEALISREDGKSFSSNNNTMLSKERDLFIRAFSKSQITRKLQVDLSDYQKNEQISTEQIMAELQKI